MPFQIVKLVGQPTPVIVTGGLVPMGAFDVGVTYNVGDSVDYNGSSYVLFASAVAGTLPTDTDYWQVLANKGDQGEKGDTGFVETLSATDPIYFGEPTTEGTWRIVRNSNNLSFQRLESSVWVEKGAVLP